MLNSTGNDAKQKSLSKLIERLFILGLVYDYFTTVSSTTTSFFFNASAAFPFLTKSNMIGVAINKDEYVPTTTPMIKANINPLIESPPKIKIANNTTKVVKDVFNVRLKVLLNEVSITLLNGQSVCSLKNSRILSNTTTVSFNEYPITVRIAETE